MKIFDIFHERDRVAEVRVLDSGEVELDSPQTEIVNLYMLIKENGLGVMKLVNETEEKISERVDYLPLSGKTVGLFLQNIFALGCDIVEREEV